jgi:hypothetical protein
MGMSEQDEIDLIEVVRERLEVESLLPVTPLVHPTVDQEARAAYLDHVVGSRHHASSSADL